MFYLLLIINLGNIQQTTFITGFQSYDDCVNRAAIELKAKEHDGFSGKCEFMP